MKYAYSVQAACKKHRKTLSKLLGKCKRQNMTGCLECPEFTYKKVKDSA